MEINIKILIKNTLNIFTDVLEIMSIKFHIYVGNEFVKEASDNIIVLECVFYSE